MRLLSKKEISGIQSTRRDFDIQRKVKLADEYKIKLQDINNIKVNLDKEKLKVIDDLNNFTEKCRLRKEYLTIDVKKLEDRKKIALELVEHILKEAENIKNEAIEVNNRNIKDEKKNEEDKERIQKNDVFVKGKIDELINRELLIRDTEKETKTLKEKAKDKVLKLAEDIEMFDEKKKKQDDKNLKIEKEVKNDKFLLKNERESIDKEIERVKKDRLHLQSQITTFNLAKNEYTRKSKN